MDLLRFDWAVLLADLLKLGVAYALAFPIALERERSTRIMGLRTFPLVAVASCAYVLVAIAVGGSEGEAQARVIQGLMSGIGFIGGGAILKEGANVRGTATAASIWSVGAIGMAAAFARYEVAVLLCVVNYLTLRLLTPIEEDLGKEDRKGEEEDGEGEGEDRYGSG